MKRDQDSSEADGSILVSLLEPVSKLIKSRSTTELMINSDGKVWTERSGKLSPIPLQIPASQRFSIIRALAGYYDLVCNRESPTLACPLPVLSKGRVQALVPPIVDAPTICIRFHSRTKLSLDDLVRLGTLDACQADQLTRLVADKKNIVIAGGTGSGKTTLANALLDEIQDERLVVIEDTPELDLGNRNTEYFHTNLTFTARDAVKTSLRFRPDRVILGELRGSETLEWTKACNTGHPGSLATIHASSAQLVPHRMCALMQEATIAPEKTLFDLINTVVEAIVYISRKPDPVTGRTIRKVETLSVSKTTLLQEEIA